MELAGLFTNRVLIPALIAWGAAQAIKVPLNFIFVRKWDWTLLLRVGGMPSSHSALISSTAHAIGLNVGFNTPLFALGVVVAMIVIYDATGIRRQAGRHAEVINTMIRDLAQGHPLQQEQLREVLGHTPLEALSGLILGILVAQVSWMVWK
jgi:acid phosphatase family membrane protein YuiD